MSAIRQAAYHRAAAIDLAELTGAELRPLDLTLHPQMPPEEAGHAVRSLLQVTWEQQLRWNSPHTSLSAWRAAIESFSILVFQASKVDLTEMRGTCVPDQPFPIILLNATDAPHGRIFTLIHEFIHILFHASGHQTSRMVGRHAPEEQALEVAANSFTSTTLLPREPFLAALERYPAAARGDDEALRLFSQRVKVSPEAILRRLTDLALTPRRIRENQASRTEASWWLAR